MVWQFNFQTMTETVTSTSESEVLIAFNFGSWRRRLADQGVLPSLSPPLSCFFDCSRYNSPLPLQLSWVGRHFLHLGKCWFSNAWKSLDEFVPENFVKSFQFFAPEDTRKGRAKKSLRASKQSEGGVSGLIKTRLLFLFFWGVLDVYFLAWVNSVLVQDLRVFVFKRFQWYFSSWTPRNLFKKKR